jgi:hypothetical protein
MLQIIQRIGTAEAIIFPAQANVPAIFFTTLLHPDYHTPLMRKLTM